MTHPTIEAAQKAIAEAYEPGAHNSKAEAKAAARVILSAPPSEVEIEAAGAAMYRRERGELSISPSATYPDYTSAYIRANYNAYARAALTAARAKHLEELEGR